MTAQPEPLDWGDIDGQAALFDLETPPPVSLADKFGIPPFAIFDRRSGVWQDRKRAWLSLGIESEVGREGTLTYAKSKGQDEVSLKLAAMSGGTSVFDPVVCELVYRWFTAPGDRVLDPFAGGSVRGVTASTLGRDYVGVDIRPEQVHANRAQTHLGSSITPRWLVGDATRLDAIPDLPDGVDLVFTCPPYGDLEVYSDLERDISTWTYPEFLLGQNAAIRDATGRLADDRFACWVTSDIRDARGAYRGLVVDTIGQFMAAGLSFHNDVVILDPVGTAGIRAERPFRATRKLTRTHQHLLVFVKGDAKRAATRIEEAS